MDVLIYWYWDLRSVFGLKFGQWRFVSVKILKVPLSFVLFGFFYLLYKVGSHKFYCLHDFRVIYNLHDVLFSWFKKKPRFLWKKILFLYSKENSFLPVSVLLYDPTSNLLNFSSHNVLFHCILIWLRKCKSNPNWCGNVN
jgi:hypothetical protein